MRPPGIIRSICTAIPSGWISRNGQPTRHRELQDTVLVSPREKVEIAFVADNPGGWMFHCHVLEHQAAA